MRNPASAPKTQTPLHPNGVDVFSITQKQSARALDTLLLLEKVAAACAARAGESERIVEEFEMSNEP